MSSQLSDELERWLLQKARESIEYGLQQDTVMAIDLESLPTKLAAPAATFVTLKMEGRLRGCIGRLQPSRALAADVVGNAYGAAFQDPRFHRLSPSELKHVHISISVLSAAQPMPCATETEVLEALRPGIDGLILIDGDRRATFLPAVWSTLPNPKSFVEALKEKMGNPKDGWPRSMRALRYSVNAFEEDGA